MRPFPRRTSDYQRVILSIEQTKSVIHIFHAISVCLYFKQKPDGIFIHSHTVILNADNYVLLIPAVAAFSSSGSWSILALADGFPARTARIPVQADRFPVQADRFTVCCKAQELIRPGAVFQAVVQRILHQRLQDKIRKTHAGQRIINIVGHLNGFAVGKQLDFYIGLDIQ